MEVMGIFIGILPNKKIEVTMEHLRFKCQLLHNEIKNKQLQIKKNREFINLFNKNNDELMDSINLLYRDLQNTSYELLELEAEALKEAGL